MLEKLQNLRFLLSVMTGKLSKAEIEKAMIKEFATDPTAEMDEREKEQLDEAVEGMMKLTATVNDVVNAQAVMYKKTYDALLLAGFHADEAIMITAHGKSMISFE